MCARYEISKMGGQTRVDLEKNIKYSYLPQCANDKLIKSIMFHFNQNTMGYLHKILFYLKYFFNLTYFS